VDAEGLQAFMQGEPRQTDPAAWHPHNPNAERDARIEAEGLYTDPIHQYTTFDEDEDDPKVKPAAPDFDL
jgi:hypothetical protein